MTLDTFTEDSQAKKKWILILFFNCRRIGTSDYGTNFLFT